MRLNELQIGRRMDKARAFVEEGKLLHAEQIYRRLIQEEPGFVGAYSELATIFAESSRPEASIEVLNHARKQFPESIELTFMLGNVFLREARHDEALSCYKKIVDSKLPHVHFNMGVAYFLKGNLKSAEAQFRITLGRNPNFPKINEYMGELLITRKSYAEAVQHLHRGITIDPYSRTAHFLLGTAYHATSNLKKAYDEFVMAIDMDPNDAEGWYKCGEVLIELKRYDEAEKYTRKALELDPDSADALVNLGQLFLLRGNHARSEECFLKALSLNPRHSRARMGRIQSKSARKG